MTTLEKAVDKKVREMDNVFHLVMILEHFEVILDDFFPSLSHNEVKIGLILGVLDEGFQRL